MSGRSQRSDDARTFKSTKRVGNSYRRTYYSPASAAAAADAVPYLESVDISSFYPLFSSSSAFVLRGSGEEETRQLKQFAPVITMSDHL